MSALYGMAGLCLTPQSPPTQVCMTAALLALPAACPRCAAGAQCTAAAATCRAGSEGRHQCTQHVRSAAVPDPAWALWTVGEPFGEPRLHLPSCRPHGCAPSP